MLPLTPTQLLDAALAHVEPPRRRSLLLGEALRNAGLLEMPESIAEFRTFVAGPFWWAAVETLGTADADLLTTQLLGVTESGKDVTLPHGLRVPTSGGAPEQAPADKPPDSTLAFSRRPAQVAGKTQPYQGQAPKVRGDVLLIEPDTSLQERARVLLESRGYRLFALKDASKAALLCSQLTVALVIASDEADGASVPARLREELGEQAPPVLLLAGKEPPPAPPAGVARVVDRRLDGSFVDAVEQCASQER
ncbi:MAG: hypothetical protein JRI68_30040 [Deltaproteobacteria bacterium]|nr:hypothetical protein [Deltaproteobacteria bacterium]